MWHLWLFRWAPDSSCERDPSFDLIWKIFLGLVSERLRASFTRLGTESFLYSETQMHVASSKVYIVVDTLFGV